MDSSRPGSERGTSRASTVIFGSAINRRLIESPGGFDPNYDTEDLEVEDYGSVGSDLELSESDLEYSSGEEEGNVEASENFKQMVVRPEMHVEAHENRAKDNVAESVDVDSEEEKAILAQIKDEIKNHVRDEMKDELLDIHLESPDSKTKANVDDDPSLDNLEPQIKEAILKMRKYDRILAKKEKREIEVKRERIRLQRRLREELDELKKYLEGKQQPRKEELANTDKFLALVPPPKHDQDVTEESPPVTPVFTTQLPDSEFADRKENASRRDSDSTNSNGPSTKENSSSVGSRTNRSGGAKSSYSNASTASTSLGGKMSQSESSLGGRRSKSKKKKKSFIERNIELASDAGNAIAMTDDEKCRLDHLLKDISNLPDIPEDGVDVQAFEVAIRAGDGFSADQDQRELLTGIDERLKSILPDNEVKYLSSVQDYDVLSHSQYMTSDMRVSMNFERLGEPTLRETKHEREMKAKLEDVEKELEFLSTHADLDVATPATLSEDALNILLGEYAESLRATQTPQTTLDDEDDVDSEGETPAIMNIYENAPKLDDDVLQKLLREAKSGMSFHELEGDEETKALPLGNVTDRTADTSESNSRLSRRASDSSSAARPVTGSENRPTTGDNRSFTSENRPFTGENRPTTGEYRPTTGERRPKTGERPTTSEEIARPSNEPRVFLPDINLHRSMVSGEQNRPSSRDRQSVSDDLVLRSMELSSTSLNEGPPLVAPPRRPPRNLQPISTRLELNISDDEQS